MERVSDDVLRRLLAWNAPADGYVQTERQRDTHAALTELQERRSAPTGLDPEVRADLLATGGDAVRTALACIDSLAARAAQAEAERDEARKAASCAKFELLAATVPEPPACPFCGRVVLAGACCDARLVAERLRAEVAALTQERDSWREQSRAAMSVLDAVRTERDSLRAEIDAAVAVQVASGAMNAKLEADNARLRERLAWLECELRFVLDANDPAKTPELWDLASAEVAVKRMDAARAALDGKATP